LRDAVGSPFGDRIIERRFELRFTRAISGASGIIEPRHNGKGVRLGVSRP
jgi:hypothetical protein